MYASYVNNMHTPATVTYQPFVGKVQATVLTFGVKKKKFLLSINKYWTSYQTHFASFHKLDLFHLGR